ncbi:MAG: hypothetical protein GON13_00825 [Nanoarchaeota archaeon]|nr:hypothetical protein [Nanoarchaeota archaeon]
MDKYYKNFVYLFTNPERSFKKFNKDGLKKSFQITMTTLITITILQYLILIISGDTTGIITISEIVSLLPFYITFSAILAITTIVLTAILSAFCAKTFFKGKNNWKQTLTLLNYVVLISYAFVIPMQLFAYLPGASIIISITAFVSLILSLRAAGLAVSKMNKITKLQGLLIYFSINLIISLPITYALEYALSIIA